MKVLIIAYVWPEPNSSAAGLRDLGLLLALREGGYKVYCSSPSKESVHSHALNELGIETVTLAANDPAFDEYVKELQPDFVVFDRFVTEEQFGWRVELNCPQAVRILDTQDLHFLRRGREKALQSGTSLADIFACRFDLVSEDALRELASIYRSDLTWVLSDFEATLLKERFNIPAELCRVSRFFYAPPSGGPVFSARRNFVMLGNFRHAPNADAVHWLKSEIWPAIRAKLPAPLKSAEVHVYGAYPSREMMGLSDPASGFKVMGPAKDQYEVLSGYRVNLAPLRFGAGIKGKISDGWSVGTPAVTTPIGSEGMTDGGGWGGFIAHTVEEFARQAVELYAGERKWQQAQWGGHRILRSLFDGQAQTREILETLKTVRADIDARRGRNIVGAMLRHHLHKSTTYMSRWIELKSSVKQEVSVLL